MTKQQLVATIIGRLKADLSLLTAAARHAHASATHEKCRPDNKYDTTALEASYIAQERPTARGRSGSTRRSTADWNCMILKKVHRSG